jgi:hypothetical protein
VARGSSTHDHNSPAAAGRCRRPLPRGRPRDVRRDPRPSCPATATKAAAPACPQFTDPIKAAADRRVDVERITPAPVWRKTCGTLYRSDSRGPATVFEQGFYPKDVINGQYDIEQYVLVNQPSPYVSTTYDHDLYKTWYKSGYN